MHESNAVLKKQESAVKIERLEEKLKDTKEELGKFKGHIKDVYNRLFAKDDGFLKEFGINLKQTIGNSPEVLINSYALSLISSNSWFFYRQLNNSWSSKNSSLPSKPVHPGSKNWSAGCSSASVCFFTSAGSLSLKSTLLSKPFGATRSRWLGRTGCFICALSGRMIRGALFPGFLFFEETTKVIL